MKSRKMFLIKMQKMLETERTQIIDRLANADPSIDYDGDDTDIIQAKILSLANSQIVNRNKENLHRIENALRKIYDGSFGVCEECGEEIAEKRLVVNPGFITCIGCAEELEIQRKQSASR